MFMYRIMGYKSVRHCHNMPLGAQYTKCQNDHANEFDFSV